MKRDADETADRKELVKVEVADGMVNFVCLREECPESCCGPFGGVQRGIESIKGRAFSEIVLTDEDARHVIGSGASHVVELTEQGYYRMRLLPDGTCTALLHGFCSIHDARPTLCRAFPFYVDMFVGLCAVTCCPGFGAGWTPVCELQEEVAAAKEMYRFWLSRIEGIGREKGL